MSAPLDVSEVGDNIRKDQQQRQQHEQGAGGHQLLSASQQAIRELALALEQDSDGWHSEREAWAKERAALEASLAYKERHVELLKKENRRLARAVGDTKRENERHGRESLRLREENADLVVRNARLDARNLQMRQKVEALAERNRKLKATVERELLGDINPNSGASTSASNSVGAKTAAAGQKSLVAAPTSVKPEENNHSIAVPNVSRGSSGRSGTHRRRGRRTDNSDTDEVITPKSTAAGEDQEPPATMARDRAETVANGGEAWRLAAETTEAAHAVRREAGLTGTPPLGCSEDSRNVGGGNEVRRLGTGINSTFVTGNEVESASDDKVLLCDGTSRRAPRAGAAPSREIDGRQDFPSAQDGEGGRTRRRRSRSSDGRNDGGGGGGSRGSSGSSSGTLSASDPVHSAAHGKEDTAASPPPAVSNRGTRPTSNSSLVSKSSCSSSSGRKRSRLSLGGGFEGRLHTAMGRAVEITEVLEAPRPRSAASAAGEKAAGAGLASPDSRLGHASRSPVITKDTERTTVARATGQDSSDEPAKERRQRGNPNGTQSFSGAPLAAEKIGSSWDGAGSRAQAGPGRGSSGALEGGRLYVKQRAGKPKQRSKKQASDQQKPLGHFFGPQCANAGATSSALPSTVSTMHTSSGRPDTDSRRKDGAVSRRDREQLGCMDGDTYGVAAAQEGGERQWIMAARGAGVDGADETSTGRDVVYPRLTMAVVTSPKKKARPPRHQQQQEDQQQQQQEATEMCPAGSSDPPGDGRRRGSPTAGGVAADDRMGETRRRYLSEFSEGGSSRGVGPGAGDDTSAGRSGRNENSAPPEHAGDGALKRRGRWREFAETDTRVSSTHPQDQTESGGGEREYAACEKRAAAAAAEAPAEASAVARHVIPVVNPYVVAGRINGGGGGGGERQTREDRPAYKFQEVVRDRVKRATMKGHDCEHCAAYLAAVGGSPGEQEAMLNMCSRHKFTEANGPPAETPDGYWQLSFADSIDRNKEL